MVRLCMLPDFDVNSFKSCQQSSGVVQLIYVLRMNKDDDVVYIIYICIPLLLV